MFCPNCGTQNSDSSAKCDSCGFTLQKPGASPKFKGTMLMMNSPVAGQPGGFAPPASQQPSPAQAVAASQGGQAEAPRPRPKIKGTMIGVAPPSFDAAAPGTTPPNFQNPGSGYPPAPSVGQPYGAPVHPPSGIAPTEAMPATQPQAPQPGSGGHERVNPLGGTMVASQMSEELQANIAASLANPPAGLERPSVANAENPLPQSLSGAPPAMGGERGSGMTVLQILLTIFTFGLYYVFVVKKQQQ